MKRRETPIGEKIESVADARAMSSGVSLSGECCNYNMTPRNVNDCLDLIETVKHAHPSSIAHFAAILGLCASLGMADMAMLQAGLQGRTFTEYALQVGTSRQAVFQRWKRVTKRLPQLARIFPRQKNTRKEQSNDGEHEGR